MPKLKKRSYDMRRQNVQLLTDARLHESCEKKITRQSLDRKRKAEERNNETEVQKIKRQTLNKERTAKARDNETVTQIITRQTLNRERTAKARDNETVTQKITRQTLDKEKMAQFRDNETEAQKITRQTLNRERTGKARDNETVAQKMSRQSLNRERTTKALDNESVAQKMTRQSLNRERTAKARDCEEQISDEFSVTSTDMDLFRFDRQTHITPDCQKGGGIMILARKDRNPVQYIAPHDIKYLEYGGIQATINKTVYTILCLYRRPQRNIPEFIKQLTELLDSSEIKAA